MAGRRELPPKLTGIAVIASSTGGPKVLREVLRDLDLGCAVIVVQHMPDYINESMRTALQQSSGMPCLLAKHLQAIEPAKIYLAPSNVHLELQNGLFMLEKTERVNFVCPAADVTMCSLRPDPEVKLMGIVLTGMGRDGAKGIQHIKSLGGTTVAQAPDTCSVDGMPSAAIATGAVDMILSPDLIRGILKTTFGQQ